MQTAVIRAFKAFEPGLICRGVKLKENEINEVPEANCAKNGWHCARNPIDCLSYYPNFAGSVFCIVEAAGDIDEDAVDSKISCTKMKIVKRLSHFEFIYHCVAHAAKTRDYKRMKSERAEAHAGYALIHGLEPLGKGNPGDIIGMIKHDEKGVPITVGVYTVGADASSGVWFDIDGEAVEDDERN